MKVSGTIQQVLKEGLVINFDGQTGLVHQTHTPAYTLGQYKEGSEVRGTVLYTLSKNKSIHLSLLPHLSGATCGSLNDQFSTLAEDKTMPHNAQVFDVMEWKVWFTLDNGVRALATRPHLRAVATDMTVPLKTTFQVGDMHRCTVTGYNLMENVVHIHLSGKTEPSKTEESHKQMLESGKTDAESEPKSKKKKSEKGDKSLKDERNLKSVSDASNIDNVRENKKKKKSKSESDITCETDNSESVKSAKKKKLKEKKKSAMDISESESDDGDDYEVTGTNKRKVNTDHSEIQERKTKLKKRDRSIAEESVKETPSKKVKGVKEELVKETPSKKVKAVKGELVKETPSKKVKAVKGELVKETPSKKVKAVKGEPETPAKKTKADKGKVVKETPKTEKSLKEKLPKETPGKKDKGIKEKSVKETPSKKGKIKSTEESDSGIEVNKASDSDDDDEDMKVPKVGSNPPRLSLSAGFSFSEDFSVAPTGVNDDSSDEEVEETKPVKKTAHERQQERIEEEKKIYAYERQQLEGDQVPVSSDDFDDAWSCSPPTAPCCGRGTWPSIWRQPRSRRQGL
ncbi:titin homolog [Haliotis rubra]|uniref:titin homolog n=1 Tax=Haliotis rubra TaxID=36100 RepID=UPI001EE5A4EA|nr:titin homolog [Haliotis rubra]